MMREILFRGKRVDNDAWVEGLLTIMWGQYHIIQPNDENTAYPIILKTIGQYTGMTDKKGTKIFEGDIIDFSGRSDGEGYGVVQYDVDETEFGIVYDSIYEGLGRRYYSRGIEVIGNIFDNPELSEEW
nr:MAG TPA: YopX protein [Caudoviricetes sp.]